MARRWHPTGGPFNVAQRGGIPGSVLAVRGDAANAEVRSEGPPIITPQATSRHRLSSLGSSPTVDRSSITRA